MTSIASANAGAFTRTLHGLNVAGVYDTYTKDLYRYQLLYDTVISRMNKYINYFSRGEYDDLTKTFTINQYNSLILRAEPARFQTPIIESLTGFEYNPEKFNLMRQSAYNVIDGLEKTITLVEEKFVLEERIVTLETNYKDVLEDPIKLRDYINSKKLDVIAFEASEPFNTVIELKPWYTEYFIRHGPPPFGVFQSELLAEIVIDLIKSGTITEDQFINS